MGYIFISYSSKNQEQALAVKTFLNKHKIETWIAPGDIPAGSQYAQVINQALKNCSGMLLLLTEESQESIWVSKEVERAIHYNKTVIPLQIGKVILNDSFEFYLSSNQVIVAKEIKEDTKTMQNLLRSVKTCLRNINCIQPNWCYMKKSIDDAQEPMEDFSDREFGKEKAIINQRIENVSQRNDKALQNMSLRESLFLKGGQKEIGDSVNKRMQDFKGSVSVIGIGGCGCNMVNRLLADSKNCDLQKKCYAVGIREYLKKCDVLNKNKLDIENNNDREFIGEWIKNSICTDGVILLCGLGGKIGNEYVQLLAKESKKLNKFVVIGCYLPFGFENSRYVKSKITLRKLIDDKEIDLIISFKNDLIEQKLSLKDMHLTTVFRLSDRIMKKAIEKILQSDTTTMTSIPKRVSINISQNEKNASDNFGIWEDELKKLNFISIHLEEILV